MSEHRVCHVGHTGSDADRDRWLIARIWLERSASDRREARESRAHCRDEDPRLWRHDHLDLRRRPSRDFLAEQETYDIVILHDLCGTTTSLGAPGIGGATRSERHDTDAWRRRLERSLAHHVFVFGTELGLDLGDSMAPEWRRLNVPAPGFLEVLMNSRSMPSDAAAARPISRGDLAEARLRWLDELRANETLDLSGTRPTVEALRRVAGLAALRELRLVSTAIDDAHVEVIAGSGGLEALALDATRSSDAGIGCLRSLDRLATLTLDDTKISDAALPHLSTLRSLDWLSLVNTRVTDAGVRRLEAALPRCLVVTPEGDTIEPRAIRDPIDAASAQCAIAE